MGRSGSDRRAQGCQGLSRNGWVSPGAVDPVPGLSVLRFLGWSWGECSSGLAALSCGLFWCVLNLEEKKALSGVSASFLIIHPHQAAEGTWREAPSGEVCGPRVCYGQRFASLVSALGILIWGGRYSRLGLV